MPDWIPPDEFFDDPVAKTVASGRDMFVECFRWNPKKREGVVKGLLVRTHSDGHDRLFSVTNTINATDLRSLLRLYESRFEEGVREGRKQKAAELRKLISEGAE